MFSGSYFSNLEEIAIYVGSVGVQIGYAVVNVLMSKQLSGGINPLAFVVYSNAIAALVLSPFAFFMERKKRSAMSMPVFYRLLLISIGGVSAFQALTLIGLRDTSAALASAMPNLAPAIIFVMAWILGMEKVDITCKYSRSKIAGTVICVCGAMAMSLVQGPPLSHLWPHSPGTHSDRQLPLTYRIFLRGAANPDKYWIVGSIYLVVAVVILCSATILQAKALKTYPAILSLTVMTGLLGSIETAILQIILDCGINEASWTVDWSGFWTILYAGVVCCGLSIAVQLWYMKRKGPVFVAIFNPVCTVSSAILSFIFLRETLYLGSALGVLLTFAGLYFVLWGKAKDNIAETCNMTSDEEKQFTNGAVGHQYYNYSDVSDVNKPLLQ